MRPSLRVTFQPHDIWIGVFWRVIRKIKWVRAIEVTPGGGIMGRDMVWGRTLDVFICVLPMLPIHIAIDLPAKHEITH